MRALLVLMAGLVMASGCGQTPVYAQSAPDVEACAVEYDGAFDKLQAAYWHIPRDRAGRILAVMNLSQSIADVLPYLRTGSRRVEFAQRVCAEPRLQSLRLVLARLKADGYLPTPEEEYQHRIADADAAAEKAVVAALAELPSPP